MFQDSSVVRFLRFDPKVSGLNPPSSKLSLTARREESQWLTVTSSVGITRRGHIEREDLALLDKQKNFSVPKWKALDI